MHGIQRHVQRDIQHDATPPMPSIQLDTLDGCGLAIGGYPRFRYDARGGGALGHLSSPGAEGLHDVQFDPAGVVIPELCSRNTRQLGLPLPPFLHIAIVPTALAGQLDPASGQLSLQFQARFRFRIGSLYAAPDLLVDTRLSTGAVASRRHRLAGRPLDAAGEGVLVGVATVPPCGDPWLDRFLGLPDEALALLRCRLQSV
ncbi:hypothetical protein [Synechococcus sp. CBW1002]|uniref:hypothetical protein n=2 Tax=Synechococcus TaxID=1129 RepID=UPI001E32F403|nr:hypothetical protein [Synechococcus sp. CBW1002]